MSEGIYKVADAVSAIGDAAARSIAPLLAALSAQQAVNAAKAAGGKTTGRASGGPSVAATVHPVGPGLAADVIGALKSLGGRT
jgi:hypothetical protein